MKKRKFAEGGDAALEDLASGKSSGRFDSDVYKRALAFRKKAGGDEEESKDVTVARSQRPAARPTPRPTPRVAPPAAAAAAEVPKPPAAPSTPPGQIPVPRASDARAPAFSDPEGRMDMSDTGRNLRNIANALTPFGAGAANRAIGSRLTTSGILGAQGGKQIREVAKAAERGRASRAAVQANRAKRAKEAEDKYDATRASDMEAGFAKGGSVRGGGCEQRGKARCKMY
jgi:hypothetical protein